MVQPRAAGILLVLATLVGSGSPALAQEEDGRGSLVYTAEAGAGYGWYSDDYENGESLFARFAINRPDEWTWRFETGWGSRFGQTGRALSVTFIRVLDNGVTFSLGASGGSGLLAPERRFDASISRPFLSRDQLILTLRAKDEQSQLVNSTRGVSGGFVYYFPEHWIWESNVYWDRGQPGDTNSTGISTALTYGVYKRWYLVAGFSYGDASYVIVGDDDVLVDLKGRGYSLGLTRYVKPHWGFNSRVEYGSNSAYSGSGVQLSVFREWR